MPHLPDPSLNTVECVTMGHGKAPAFSDWKNLLHKVCWYILSISLIFSQVASQWLVVQLKEWNKKKNYSKVAAVMLLSLVVFISGLYLIYYAWKRSGNTEKYALVFFICVMVVLVRRAVWCLGRICCDNNFDNLCWLSLVKGHENDPSTNVISFFILYPAIFMTCHHLLWILLGVITEPFWGVSVLVAVISVSAVLIFFSYDFYDFYLSHEATCSCGRCRSEPKNCKKWFPFAMSLILVLGSCAAFVLLIIVLLVVAQSFLSESLVSTLVQNGLVIFSTVWLGYLKLHQAKETAETGNGGNHVNAGNSNQSGQPGYELVGVQGQRRH